MLNKEIEELKKIVFEENNTTKSNKDKLFKKAKSIKDIETIEKLRDEFGFKSARIYLDKLDNIVINDRDLDNFKILIEKKSVDLSKININDLIDKKYDDEFIEILITNGAPLNTQDKYGYTALMCAVEKQKTNLVKLLLKEGADYSLRTKDDEDDNGETALLMVCRNGDIMADKNIDMIKVFLEHIKTIDIDEAGYMDDLLFYPELAKLMSTIQVAYGKDNYITMLSSTLLSHMYKLNKDSGPSKNQSLEQYEKNLSHELNSILTKCNNLLIAGVYIDKASYQQECYGVTEVIELIEKYLDTTIKKTGTISFDNFIISFINDQVILGDLLNKIFVDLNLSYKNTYTSNSNEKFTLSNEKIIKITSSGEEVEYAVNSISGELTFLDIAKHNPKELSKLLQKFSSSEKLKYSNHAWDEELSYDEFMKDVKKAFDDISEDLKILSLSLHDNISKFLFEENLGQKNKNDEIISWGDGITIGFSSKEIKDWSKLGNKPEEYKLPNPIEELKTFKDVMNKFKSLIVIKENVEKLELINHFIELQNELGKLELDLSDLSDLKIDKIFTDVKKFKRAISVIIRDIAENIKDDKNTVKITAKQEDKEITIKIIHINSNSSKTAEDLYNTIEKNGGNFQTIHKDLKSLCDWEVDAVCSNGKRYLIYYLYQKNNNDKRHYEEIGNTNEGFTHILRFYECKK